MFGEFKLLPILIPVVALGFSLVVGLFSRRQAERAYGVGTRRLDTPASARPSLPTG